MRNNNNKKNIKYNNYSGLSGRDAGSESHQIRPESLETLNSVLRIKQGEVSIKLIFEKDAFRDGISDKRRIS